jgi:hypothetical protein
MKKYVGKKLEDWGSIDPVEGENIHARNPGPPHPGDQNRTLDEKAQ